MLLWFKRIVIFFVLISLAATGCIFYAFQVEPYRIKIKNYTIHARQEGAEEIKIAQISDLHIKEDFTYHNLSKVVKKINTSAPDIVVFTGDLYDNYARYHNDRNITAELQKITARYAKIAIWGNRDYGGGAARTYQELMEQSGFILLSNEDCYITLDSKRTIRFTGLDDSLLGAPLMPSSSPDHTPDYEILLTHEPDSIENFSNYKYDIALSGHSHGGQLNIPFLPFINQRATTATALSSKYSNGMYELEGMGIKKIFVHTGIGTTHISARFGVVPEISLFHLYL